VKMTRSSTEPLPVPVDGLAILRVSASCNQLDSSLTFGRPFVLVRCFQLISCENSLISLFKFLKKMRLSP
jgi:hypothetical protein